mmetsp:Transcript_143008/g.202279  ORF Transcript_143008/g.202279 Transcript_143008/m.202279 type:complete len:182 (+) Transcript_143008:27-572(+)
MAVQKVFWQKRGRTRQIRQTNPYLHSLLKLYEFVKRRATTKFAALIYARLKKSKTTRAPLSLSRLIKNLSKKSNAGKIGVIVGTVTNDVRQVDVPKGLKVACLRATQPARKRIHAAGGQVLTLEELIQQRPTGSNTFLLRGPSSHRLVNKQRGARGVPNAHFRPKLGNRGNRSGPRKEKFA